MAKITLEDTASDGDFLTLPADAVVPVVVESTEVREVGGKDGKEAWKKLNFRFKIVDLPDNLVDQYAALIGSTLFGSVSYRLTMHPDNKLRQWTEALLDVGELEAGFELDTDMFVGKKARAIIGHWTRKSDNSLNHQVDALLPATPVTVGGSGSSAFAFDEPPF